ncbi:putative sugar nucleotidyl transferase [Rhodopirellula halodulae]|uniref:putative sugar nucleotidyl transferase n=1 Tax=Rhodopirellula halodulae TaxID=2894198 RepID=UPI001E56E7F7|nr:putative sugar nucleotidyl transferase [Rhodopirellula sp. JC737]MCC9658917.1 glucose-1-phosphate thymidylyltransferase [Rhodopirellula sp. JC737]
MHILCFEDSLVDQLCPIVHARPAYAITCASFRLVDWLRTLGSDFESKGSSIHGHVRDYLLPIQSADHGLQPPIDRLPDGDVLLINARLVPSVATYRILKSLANNDRSVTIESKSADGASVILAARVSAQDIQAATQANAQTGETSSSALEQLLELASQSVKMDESLSAFQWPHEVVSEHMTAMNDSVEYRIEHGNYQQREDGVFVRDGVSIGEYGSIRTSGGAIVLEEDVQVGPFCFLEGPLHAGRKTRVIEHSAIKDGVSLGHTVKIGGEVEASVIEAFTNKQHHGFLGHSYLGSWINLGAGTCNSDLKNTYGKINIEYGDRKMATGMQFLGCIMGDYSKSAINTGIFTGKVIGVCSMLYGFVTSNVPSYVNYARLFGQTSLLPPDVMINTQARMFARRKVEQRQCDMDLIHAMYHRTESEREASEQLGL